MKAPFGELQFFNVSNPINIRRNREHLTTSECREYFETHRDEFCPRIVDIMKACDLTPVPRFTNRHELARCRGTRYGSDQAVVPELVYCQL